MGRKIELKRIEDNTKSQVTFSKRRNSLMRKAEEFSICCDVDVAILAFSPSGRISEYCNYERMDDLLSLYADLPADNRLSHIQDIQRKIEKLKQLDYIGNDYAKAQHLQNQIQNLQLQINKKQRDVLISEADLRNFEFDPEQASLQQLSWCEENILLAIAQLKEQREKKENENMEVKNESEMPSLYNFNQNHSGGSNASKLSQFLKDVDSLLNDSDDSDRENICTTMLDKGKGKAVPDANGAPETTLYSTKPNVPIPTLNPMHHLGVPALETQPSCTLSEAHEMQNNYYNPPIASTYSMNQSNAAFTPQPFNGQTFVPSQINAVHGFPQQYPQLNNGYDMAQYYQLWQQTQTPWQQPISSFGIFVGESSNYRQNYQSDFRQSFNYSSPDPVEANNYWWTSTGKNEMSNQTYANPNPVQIEEQPNANSNMYGVYDYGNGSNGMNNYSYENDDLFDELMSSPSFQFPPPSSGV